MKRWLFGCASLGLVGLLLPALAQDAPKPPPKEAVPEAERGEGVSLTVYNQNFVVVKERRTMTFKPGRQVVRFPDVAATIVPETVQFGTLAPADAAKVIEQNYEFDLVSAEKLLDKYIDQEVGLIGRDGTEYKGRLMSFDPHQIVLATPHGIDLIPRGKNIKDIRFASLPGGLLTRPTLVWQVEAKATGPNLVKVAYRANNMTWHVNYTARANADHTRLDLSGWVTITNNTGATFKDAQLKLMAGDLHIVQEQPVEPAGHLTETRAGSAPKAAPGFTEKSFAEYHLYELGKTTTIKGREVKQIELLDVTGIPVTKKYAYNGTRDGRRVAVALEFKNSKETSPGLGIPLPKGPIRVYTPDTDKELEFLGMDQIDHTPKDEELSVRLGYAFDLAGERRVVQQRRPSPNVSEFDIEVRLRNHTDKAVTIDVIEPVNASQNVAILKNSHVFKRPNVHVLEFTIPVPANAERVVTYTIQYSW
jgi:hypothetical protein